MITSWYINPSEIILKAKETKWVTIEFQPKKEDLILLEHNNVSQMGTISIIHGDEPTRWRIRRSDIYQFRLNSLLLYLKKQTISDYIIKSKKLVNLMENIMIYLET